MKNKGFTLAELVGVVVILTLVMLIVFPAVTKVLKQNKNEISDSTLIFYKTQAENYISDNGIDFKTVNGSIYCIKLKTLVDYGYLKEPLLDSKTSKEFDQKLFLEMTYNDNSWDAELKETCEEYRP
ncbi:MAG: type II secretion system protein [Bacilli bacterium]|nr:type II secretion system protein [Bacilli bacterium]MDD4733445.1 type II secretion system protein [Bacilli bacterium]